MSDVVEQGCYAVLVGSFNPAILTPYWMAAEGIISKKDAEQSEIEVVHRDLARFAIPNIKFDIVAERCQIMAEAEPFIRLVDIVAGLFLNSLPHTPITAAGLNYYVHYDVGDWKKRTRFGRELAPLEPWGSFGNDFDATDAEKVGGLVDLTMQSPRREGPPGHTRVTVQPSNVIPGGTGIFLQVNNHYEDTSSGNEAEAVMQGNSRQPSRSRKKGSPKAVEEQRDSPKYPEIMVQNFQAAMDHSRAIISEMLERVEKS